MASRRPAPVQSLNRSSSESSNSSGGSSQSSRPTPPRPAPVTYNDDELDYLEDKAKHATQEHLVHALDHILRVMGQNIRYAVMGGMGMVLLGNQARTTKDVDVAVEAKVGDLLAMFANDSRYG